MTDGYITIANSFANPTMDEFILNFEYLHDVGSITDYQYSQIEPYKANIRRINQELIDLAPQIDNITVEINNLEAEITSYESQISSLEEQLVTYQKLRDNALTNGVIQKDKSNSCSVVFSDTGSYRRANLGFEGIIASSISGYSKYDYSTKLFSPSDLNIVSSESVPVGNNIDLILDDTGFPAALATKRTFESNIVYLELQYSPANKYKKLCSDLWKEKERITANLSNANQEIEKKKQKLSEIESQYDSKLKEKERINLEFENLMGSALREGYWTAEDYQDPRENIHGRYGLSSSSISSSEPTESNFIFDAIPFEDEFLAWEPNNEEPNKKKYYKYTSLFAIKDKLTKSFTIHLWREFTFTSKLGGETFVAGNYLIIYNNNKYYFSLPNDYRISKIILSPNIMDQSTLRLTFSVYNGGGFDIYCSQNPLSSAIDITSKFEGIGAHLGEYVLYENAGYVLGYLYMPDQAAGSQIQPVILYNNTDIPYDNYSKVYLKFDDGSEIIQIDNPIENSKKYELCYPRIFLAQKNILYSSDALSIQLESSEDKMEKFIDYSILIRNGRPYITLKTVQPFNYFNSTFCLVDYQISRANEMLYLDAQQVAKDNSKPRISYEVQMLNLPEQINIVELGQLVYINDYLLGSRAVSGYVSEIEYDLSMPKNDKISVKNYKTKFEDLFSTISAQSEAMKVNKLSYDNAANSFEPGGLLAGGVLQDTIIKESPYFDYSSCGVKITDDSGIVLTNDKPYSNGTYGQVVLRGSGIFVSDSVDPTTGKRVWSNAITANGINASSITTGQLDTNLIRIFSGDQMRFQWNSEGLIAYKSDGITGVDNNTFIKFSDNGLHYYQADSDAEKAKIPVVSLDWDGLTLRNARRESAIYLDRSTGNIVVNGTIYASSGVIGGLKIESTTLENLNSIASSSDSNIMGLVNGDTSVGYVKTSAITIKDSDLTLNSSGNLILKDGSDINILQGATFATQSGNFFIDAIGNVSMTGRITANSGSIAGFTIGPDSLSVSGSGSYAAFSSNPDYPVIWTGNADPSYSQFKLYKNGQVQISALRILDEDGTTVTTANLYNELYKMNVAYSHAVKTLSVANGTLTIELYDGTRVDFT